MKTQVMVVALLAAAALAPSGTVGGELGRAAAERTGRVLGPAQADAAYGQAAPEIRAAAVDAPQAAAVADPTSRWQETVDQCSVKAPARDAREFVREYRGCFSGCQVFTYLLGRRDQVGMRCGAMPDPGPDYIVRTRTEYTGKVLVPSPEGGDTRLRVYEDHWVVERRPDPPDRDRDRDTRPGPQPPGREPPDRDRPGRDR